MRSTGSVAADVRRAKERRPTDFCGNPVCLWRVQTRDGYKACPKHPGAPFNLKALVTAVLDGHIPTPAPITNSAAASDALVIIVTERAGRPLTDSERATVEIEAGVEWNQRREAERAEQKDTAERLHRPGRVFAR